MTGSNRTRYTQERKDEIIKRWIFLINKPNPSKPWSHPPLNLRSNSFTRTIFINPLKL